jgi:hypothetical protein
MSNSNLCIPIKKLNFNYKIATFDIEASNWINIIVIGFFDGKDYLEFKNIKDLLNYILTQKYKYYKFYAHFGGKYDFNFILNELIKRNIGFEIITSNSRIIEIKVGYLEKKNNKKYFKSYWKFIDSFNLLPFSLKELMKTFLKEEKVKIDFEKDLNEQDILARVKSDTISLYKILKIFYEQIKTYQGNVKLTLASTSLNIFKRNYLKIPIPTYISYENELRQGYYGGRVEIFKLEFDEIAYYYDFDSLYPYCMRNYDMPVGFPDLIKDKDIDDYFGFALAKVKCSNRFLPLLPYRNIENNISKLIFPIGEFEGIYDIDLLKFAQKEGYEIEPKKIYSFEKKNLFKDFIDFFHKEKINAENNNDLVKRMITKLLMNALYGKFAQKRIKEKILNLNSSQKLEGLTFYNEEYGLIKEEIFNDSPNILPCISMRITSMALLNLYLKLKEANENQYYYDSKKLFYCDTDSIITSTQLKYSEKPNLGSLRKIYTLSKGIFLLPKVYFLEIYDKNEFLIKIKGFENKNYSYQDFKNALKSGNYTDFSYKKIKFLTFKESLRRNKQIISLAECKKSIEAKYDKRNIHNKIYTKPIEIVR